MSLLVVAGVGALGGFGAIARFLLDGSVSGRLGRGFPFGTLAVNVSGAFVLGALAGATLSDTAYRLAGLGLIGGFTTYSTWALESHRLAEDGALRHGLLNLAVSLALGIPALWAGRHLGAAL